MPAKVLFITAIHPPQDTTSPPLRFNPGPDNTSAARELLARGAKVDFRTFRDDALTADVLASYTHIVLLVAWGYNYYVNSFRTFISERLAAAKKLNPTLRILNNQEVILWNHNKLYLQELLAANHPVPKTRFLAPETSLSDLRNELSKQQGPQVVKPSISASNFLTHLIQDPQSLSKEDHEFLDKFQARLSDPATVTGSAMIQEFLPSISNRGEYSLIFIASKLTHAVVKKPKESEFRVGSVYGGRNEIVHPDALEGDAVEVASRAFEFLEQKAGGKGKLDFVRLDGVTGEDGKFVIMEAECIEPYLWLDERTELGRAGLNAFCDMIQRQ